MPAQMGKSVAIDHYEPAAVMRGLLDGAGFHNRVAGDCIYACPRCAHRIRFRWRSFYQADGRSPLPRQLKRIFDDCTPVLSCAEQSALDFYCPTCQAPTRIIFGIQAKSQAAYHFDIYAALVGAGQARA